MYRITELRELSPYVGHKILIKAIDHSFQEVATIDDKSRGYNNLIFIRYQNGTSGAIDQHFLDKFYEIYYLSEEDDPEYFI